MDDPLPKTALDHYTYKINNFHPSLDSIIMSILKRRCTPGMKKCKSDKWTNRYLSRPSSWTTLIFRGEDTLSPISCFPNNYYEYFVSISICSLLGWHSEGVTSVEKNWSLYPDIHVIKLTKVLLLLPATITEAEQDTFFTWLRSTVSGKLKGSTTFHLLAHHKCVVDQLDSKTIANELIVKFESRKLHFELGSC